jgi:HK97 family phage major capsid protein
MSKLIDLKNKRAGLVQEMRLLLDTAEKAGRDLNADEQSKYTNLEADVEKFGKTITREEGLSQFENELRAQRDANYRPDADGGKSKKANATEGYRAAFSQFLRAKGNASILDRQVFATLQTGVDSDGGFLVPEEFEANIQKLLYNLDPMRSAATVLSLSTDRHLPIQTGGATFQWIGENGSYPSVSPTVGRVTLTAHKLGGYVPVSEELLQDSGSNVEQFVTEVAAQSVADLENGAFTVGNGAAQPLGIFTTTSVGGVTVADLTGAVSATAAITGDNIIDTYHTLGRQYRDQASWVGSDTLIKLIRKIKDNDGQYIWQPGLIAGQPDRILNRPVFTSDFAPTPAVSTRSLAFGDLRRYYIADRLGMGMLRLNELGALNGQVYFRVTKRTDGRLTDGNAVVFFKHGAAS